MSSLFAFLKTLSLRSIMSFIKAPHSLMLVVVRLGTSPIIYTHVPTYIFESNAIKISNKMNVLAKV